MSKARKTLLIVALCLVVVGTATAAAATMVIRTRGIHWVDERDTYPPREMSEEWDDISALEFALVNEPVNIVRGGDAVKIEWSQRYDDQYRVSREGGTLRITRAPHGGSRWRFFDVDFDWLASLIFGGRAADIEDGYSRPITVTVPEDVELREIEIDGVDLDVFIDGIRARDIEVNGVNAQVEFLCDDPDEYDFETNGLGSELIIDGRKYGDFGRVSSRGDGNYSVSVDGMNAVLEVRTR